MKKAFILNVFLVLLIVLTITFPAFACEFNPFPDITLDRVPNVDYHPTIVLGEPVIIQNQDAYASPLFFIGASRELGPLVMYVNGVQAHRLHRWDGSGEDGYVEITIGGNGLDAGLSGLINERHLVSSGAKTSVLPIGTLYALDAEDVALFLDFMENAPIIAMYPNGTQAQLMGYLLHMYHVQIGNQTGFIKTSQLLLPPAVAQEFDDALPKRFIDLNPVHKHIIEIGWAYEVDRLVQYGRKSKWPL